MSIEKIEYLENCICPLMGISITDEVYNIFSDFKYIEKMNLKKELENIKDRFYYKYTHEAVLPNINTHGFFQYTLFKKKDVPLEKSYAEYLESRILDIYSNLKTDEAFIITIELYALIASYLALELNIDKSLKEVLFNALKQIIDAYEYYAGRDGLSVMLLDKKNEIKGWI